MAIFMAMGCYAFFSKDVKGNVRKCKAKMWIAGFKKSVKWKRVLVTIVASVFVFTVFPKSQNLVIHFVDVGQGDCCLVITPTGKTMLVDGGGSENIENYDVGESVLVPYLLDKKIKTIDYMLVSHFHADHSNGLLAVLDKLKVKTVIFAKQEKACKEYENFIKKVKQNNSKVIIAKDGQSVMLDNSTKLEILQAGIKSDNLNNTSVVAKLVYGNFSMLFTGDAEVEEEQVVLKNVTYEKLKANVLKLGHHRFYNFN